MSRPKPSIVSKNPTFKHGLTPAMHGNIALFYLFIHASLVLYNTLVEGLF